MSIRTHAASGQRMNGCTSEMKKKQLPTFMLRSFKHNERQEEKQNDEHE